MYQARLWRKWANMEDSYKSFDTETEAMDYIHNLYKIAKTGDTITVKQSIDDWHTKTILRVKVQFDGEYWQTRKPYEPIPVF